MAFKSKERSREYGKEWYYKNHESRLKHIRDFRTNKRKLYLNKIVQYLKSHPCVDCGQDNIMTLEFDHLGNKKDNVMHMVKILKNWKLIELEIAKCEIRCSNCHKIKTYKNSFRDIA